MERYLEIERTIIKKYRKEIWSKFVKAVIEYKLIEENDNIMVCISGGKDSFLMAKCFQELKRHGKYPFNVHYVVMDPGYSSKNIELINIDHHHDLGYPVDSDNNNKMHCGNWVKKLFNEKRIKEYIWIKNDYSTPPRNCDIEYIEYNINDIALTDICDDCDKIFICLSSAWIPPYYI